MRQERIVARARGARDRLRANTAAWREEPLKAVAARHRLLEPWRRRQFHSFGSRSIVDRPAWIYGPGHIDIGESTVIFCGAWLAVERPAWDRPAPALTIGDRVWIRPFATLSAAESIVIEDDVVFGAMVSVVDSDHSHDAGKANVLDNPVRSSPIRIGRGTWIADRTAVLAGAQIGVGCMIGANSVVRGVIPDYSVAVGAPARVVRTTSGDDGAERSR
jgi:lipopolysaccharide O-acetyltransferase